VGSALIVVDAPGFDRRPFILERHELHDVRTFVAQPAVE
jgi:hypothetical protein